MNPSDQTHVSGGRIPWRRLFQLRHETPARVLEAAPVLSLSSSAQTAEPPLYLADWQQHEAKRRLITLCEWLDDHLDQPAHVSAVGKAVRRVTVFDSLAYDINVDRRAILSGTVFHGRYDPSNVLFEIGRPLTSHLWLMPVLRNLNLANATQGDLFFVDSELDDIAQWLARSAYRLLLRNPDFQEFRRNQLPKLFKLPKDIYSIALASRPRPVGPLIDSRTFNDVWRNEKAFRQVARENPHLLPLLQAFIEQVPDGETVRTKDPVLTLKKKFRDSGLSEASWRYVVHHGSKLFRDAWSSTSGQETLEVAVRYLDALESAGLPPPPPPSIVKAWLHGYNPHRENDARLEAHFQHMIDPVALRAGLIEADRLRQKGRVEGFAEEFLGVCWWSEHILDLLDENQARAGWSWFVRRWQEAEAAQAILEDTEQLHWMTRLEEFQKGRMTVVPIDSSESLILESLAMRNCLQSYIEDCAKGKFEVYSVRETQTRKRKGCIGIRFDDDGMPTIADVKGFANTPPIGEVQQIAYELFMKLQHITWE